MPKVICPCRRCGRTGAVTIKVSTIKGFLGHLIFCQCGQEIWTAGSRQDALLEWNDCNQPNGGGTATNGETDAAS